MINQNIKLMVMGEVMMRLSPEGNERMATSESFKKHIGGAELNVAAGASNLGLKTGILTKLPNNLIGTFAKNQMSRCGVDCQYISYDSEPDARLGVYYYESGSHPRKPQIVYDRKNSSINKVMIEDFPEEAFEEVTCFHTSGITLGLGGKSRQAAIEMMKKYKEKGSLISFDVNFRGNLWTGEQARECIEEILPLVDIFFCSEDTARLTFKKTGTVQEMMKSFAEEYAISIVASTQRIVHSPIRHTFGSIVYESSSNTFYTEEPYRDIEIVDRIGSGDAYISGFLYGLLNGDKVENAMKVGNAVSAVKNTIPGDVMTCGYLEIESLMQEHQGGGQQFEMKR